MFKRGQRTRAAAMVAVLAAASFLVSQQDAGATTTQRISGADRYATAAAISSASFGAGVPVAYIAVGTNFPDALAGGPAAAHDGGPVLLTTTDALPQPTVDELQRLQPGRIVILGGTSAVSPTVEQQLDQYTTGEVSRLSGANRYATAAAVSSSVFAPGVSVVHIATGAGFADALGGGVAAGVSDGPVLLVAQADVPQETRDELTRLNPSEIVVLGGTSVISNEVQTYLGNYAPSVTRVSGADRYLTAVAVSQQTFAPGVPTVYLATGNGFADALAGVSPAARAPGPLLLSPQPCLPPEVKAEIDRLGPNTVIVLGGENSLSPAVENMSVCSPPPPPPSDCTPGYSPCIPPGSDVDCAGGGGNGPRYVQGPVYVDHSKGDPYGLDSDGDGVGCEN